MSAFRLRKEAKSWFKDIYKGDGLEIDFDMYYFCLMAGIASNSKDTTFQVSDTSELIDYFPTRYKDKSKIIISLFLSRELAGQGVTLTDKKSAHNHISQLISPESQSYLSDNGVKLMNAYAYKGFENLIEWFTDRPRTLESFLGTYAIKISEMVKPIPI